MLGLALYKSAALIRKNTVYDLAVKIPAPAMDETPDVVDALEELLEAQNESFILGLKLRLAKHVVQSIHKTYSDPKDRLLHVLLEFNEQTEPKPTWGLITEALKSPAIGMNKLAEKIESTHMVKHSSSPGIYRFFVMHGC